MSEPDDIPLKKRTESYKVALDHNDEESSTDVVEDKKKTAEEAVPKIRYSELFRFATTLDYLYLVVGGVFALVHGAVFPLMFLFIGDMFDEFANTDNAEFDLTDSVNEFILYFVYLAIVNFVCAYFQFMCFTRTSQRQGSQIRKQYFSSLLRQEVGWYDLQNTGGLTGPMMDDVTKIQAGLSDRLGTFLQFFAMGVAGIGIAFFISWKLVLVTLCLVPFLCVGMAVVATAMSKGAEENQSSYAKAGIIAEEAVTLVRTVIAFNGQAHEAARYREEVQQAVKDGKKAATGEGIGLGLTWFFIFCMYSLSMWYSSKLIRDGEITGGEAVTGFFNIIMAAQGFGSIGPSVASMATAKGAGAKVFSSIDRKSKIDPMNEDGEKPSKIVGSLEFVNVFFRYPTRPHDPVFENFSLKIEPKSSVGIVGGSGCGKSTLVNLLERFYDPDSGTVRLDGTDLRDINVGWLRNHISLVNQQPALFPTSIRENIAAGLTGATEEDVINAAKMANAHDFIMDLPEGYDTHVGDGGSKISGGQKQRVAVARALIANPQVLLLDEATSSLDSDSERLVHRALEASRIGRTMVTIAHRLITVKNCDRIVVLGQDGILEDGNHDELLARNGTYAAMWEAQQMEDEENEAAGGEVQVAQRGDSTRSEAEEKETIVQDILKKFSAKMDKEPMAVDKDTKKEASTEENILNELSDPSTIDEEKKKEISKWVKQITKPQQCSLMIGIFGSILEGLTMPVYGYLISFFIGELVLDNRKDVINEWAYIFLAVGAACGFGFFFKFKFLGAVGENVTGKLREDSFTKILSHDPEWFDLPDNSKTVLVGRLAEDASLVRGVAADAFGQAVALATTLISALTLGLASCWRVGLVILSMFPILFGAGALQMKVMMGMTDSKASEKSQSTATEAIENIRTVLAMGQVLYYVERYEGALDEMIEEQKKLAHSAGLIVGFIDFSTLAVMATCFYYGAQVVEDGHCDFDEMYAAINTIFMGFMFLGQLNARMPDLAKGNLAAQRIFDLLHEEDTVVGKNSETPEVKGAIEFKNVSFTYPTRPDVPILEDVSFIVNPGEKIALVGASGCGKSTIVRLLERFYRPQSGQIFIDGVNLNDIEAEHLRENVSLVPQEPQLFSLSIEDNICYGIETQEDKSKLSKASTDANAHKFISDFSDGYDTLVGERGIKLSGGQRQRVAVARALYRSEKVNVLLFDEATSALDSMSEEIVQESLEREFGSRTMILIAHRLSTIKHVDKILIFSQGRIIEQGTHEQLLDADGVYAHLVKNQSY